MSDRNIFRFKQFEVDQSDCAMKVNTDGVLLAALLEILDPSVILDIGTGTGVIALMLAQRFTNAKVEAIEIDSFASATAKRNFENSTFSDRLSLTHIAIEDYNPDKLFDLIVSNPPYFVNDLRSAEEKKGIARHANDRFFEDLIVKVNELLSQNGNFWFILPVKQAELMINKAEKYGLFVDKQILLHSDQSNPAFRWIICLDRSKSEVQSEHFYIYEAEKVYSEAYKQLLKDFFLKY